MRITAWYFETNLRLQKQIWEHLRLQEMTLEEWWWRQKIFAQKPASASHQPKSQVKYPKTAVEGSSGLLRLRHCVTLTGQSESTLRRAIKDGRLKAHTIGRGQKRPTYGIYRSDLEGFIEVSQFQPPDSPRIPSIGVTRKSRHFD